MTVEAIKDLIEHLPLDDQVLLARWLGDRDRQTWDAEIERDFSAGGAGMALLDEVDALIDLRDPAAASHSQDEIAMVRRATEVLGADHVARWMRSGIPSLDNQTPYALIKTEDGREQIERVLLKIEHGVY